MSYSEKTCISVIVVAYNSANFIIDTLNSVSEQTWHNIELIVTDDASSDNTLSICSEWTKRNAQRFKEIKIITSEINTGISANANRGLKAASGSWIKYIAADDALHPECLDKNMKFIDKNPEVNVLFSRINIYNEYFTSANYIKTTPEGEISSHSIFAPGRTALSQYKLLLLVDPIDFSPSVFLSRKVLDSVGGFDERFSLLEDYPLWLNLTHTGYKLYFMNEITVYYRKHSRAVHNKNIPYLINPNYFRQEKFRKIYVYPNLPRDIYWYKRFSWFAIQIFRNKSLNRDTIYNRWIFSMFTAYLNPFKYLIYIRKKINKDLDKNELYYYS